MTISKITRRTQLQLAFGLALASLDSRRLAYAAPHILPIAIALNEDLVHAVKLGRPLVVMVSLEGCPFCRVVRENYLPSIVNDQKIHVVQIDMRKTTMVKDLQGRQTTHDQLSKAWGIKVAPTLLFFGKNGNEIAERLVGASVPDFYGTYLQDRIDKAILSLK